MKAILPIILTITTLVGCAGFDLHDQEHAQSTAAPPIKERTSESSDFNLLYYNCNREAIQDSVKLRQYGPTGVAFAEALLARSFRYCDQTVRR